MSWPNINCSIRGIGATVNSTFSSPWDISATVGFGLAECTFMKEREKDQKFAIAAWHAVCDGQ